MDHMIDNHRKVNIKINPYIDNVCSAWYDEYTITDREGDLIEEI